MPEKYTFEFDTGSGGLPFVALLPGARLRIEQHGNTYTIVGNSEGLLFLANNLIALATMERNEHNEGYHIHLDDLYNLNDEGLEFILDREG